MYCKNIFLLKHVDINKYTLIKRLLFVYYTVYTCHVMSTIIVFQYKVMTVCGTKCIM